MSNEGDRTAKLDALAFDPGNDLARREDGAAFLSAVPKNIRELIVALPQEILDMDESLLRERGECDLKEYAARQAFWEEYERSLQNADGDYGNMRLDRMLTGIMSTHLFLRLCRNPYKLAWILKPVRPYLQDIGFILNRGKERLWEVMNFPLYDDKGRPNVRAAQVIVGLYKQLEDRMFGETVQRQQQVRVTIPSSEMPDRAIKELEGVNDIDGRIKALERKIKRGGVPGSSSGNLPAEAPIVDVVEIQPLGERGDGQEKPVEEDQESRPEGSAG